MDRDLTYEMLWQITQRERQTNELQPLPKSFYDDVSEFIKSYSNRELTEEEANVKKNALRLANELYERRKQKILIYVAYKRTMPQPAIPRELEFYNRLLEMSDQNRVDTDKSQGAKVQTLRSLQAIPQIILPSGRKAGPFEKGQLVEIPNDEEDIKFLINNTICQQA